MSEIVTTYKLDDLDEPIPMDREEFYEEQLKVFEKTGKPSRAVEVVQVLLFTPDKKFILQKRSAQKKHNPSLLDKTIGGHVKFQDSSGYTVMAATLKELDIPSFIVNSHDEFKKTYKLLRNHVGRSAFIQWCDTRTFNFKKMFKEESIEIANKYHFYLGVYFGQMKPADQEAEGVLLYDYSVLKRELESMPTLFTDDLRFFLKKYEKHIEQFLNSIES